MITTCVYIVTIAFSVFSFLHHFVDGLNVVAEVVHFTAGEALLLLLTVAIVYSIKAIRLFFTLYGYGLKARDFLELYCKVTIVSVVLPYKLGEFFRMYSYGREINNYTKGTIIIILDRFMDTAALCTMMLFWLDKNSSSNTGGFLVFITLAVLFFLTLIYLNFPSNYQFWNKYFLEAKASEHRIRTLKQLKSLQNIYREVQSIIKGRGIILYFLSLLAWIVEVGSQNTDVASYLFSAMNGSSSLFVIVSVVTLLSFYALLLMLKKIKPPERSIALKTVEINQSSESKQRSGGDKN